jgi:hypothetical protein
MSAGSEQVRGLAQGVVGSARVIAFGTSIVAPTASAVTLLALGRVAAPGGPPRNG